MTQTEHEDLPTPSRPVRSILQAVARGRRLRTVLVLVALGAVFSLLFAAAAARSDALLVSAERVARGYSVPVLPGLRTAAPRGPVSVVVLADDAQFASGRVSWSDRFDSLSSAEVSTSSAPGLRYSGSGLATFAARAAEVPADADVVVFFGGAADRGVTSRLQLMRAATQAYARAKERARHARIIVVGPLLQQGSGASSAVVRRALHSAAAIVGARWLDPVASAWVPVSGGPRLSDAELQQVLRRLAAATAAG